jgi:hypothetical protein
MAATLARVSVSVWLPPAGHAALAAAAGVEGVSLAVLARRAAVAAVEAAGGRVVMAAPSADAVEELRAAGHALNRLLPAASAASSAAARAAIAEHIAAALDRIIAAATRVRIRTPAGARGAIPLCADRGGWRLVRVTADPHSVSVWSAAAAAAGFRSVANWVRDALAGAHGLDLPRPPAPATIDARAVAGRVLGLVAQTETAVAGWPAGGVLDDRIEAVAAALYVALGSLVACGGDPKARR